jgi:esterase/lipase superfamily enzyme
MDELNVEWTLPHFAELLRLVAGGSGARAVHVVAQGMGSRAVVRALGAPREGSAGISISGLGAGEAVLRQVVFAAPDIDRETFLGLIPRLAGRAERFTLYASSRDRALRASRIVHGHPRAGESGDTMPCAPGIDSIDAAERSILGDVSSLLRSGLPPGERSGLVPGESGEGSDGRSWALLPEHLGMES